MWTHHGEYYSACKRRDLDSQTTSTSLHTNQDISTPILTVVIFCNLSLAGPQILWKLNMLPKENELKIAALGEQCRRHNQP